MATACATQALILPALAGITIACLSGCISAKLDQKHVAQVDALVGDRTQSSMDAMALLRIDPRSQPEPPTGTLTLSEAVNRTLSRNLSLVASAESLPVAQAQLAQAGLFENPTIGQSGLVAFPLPGTGGATAFDILVTQTINTFFTRPYRVAVAEAQRFQAGIDLANQAFDLSQQAESKYRELGHLVRSRKLSEKIADSYQRAVTAAEARAKVGIIPTPDVNRARIQYEEAQRQVRHLQAQYQRASREMNWLMGVSSAPQWHLAADVETGPAQLPPLPPSANLEELGLKFRLDVLRADFDRKVSSANVELAKVGLIPQITLAADAARDSNKHWTLGPSFNSELPIFDPGTVGVALAKAQLRLVEKTYVSLQGQVRQDVRTAYENLRIADEDLRFYRDRLIPQAEENVKLAEQSFRLGNTDLDTLLNTLREYVGVLQGGEDALQAYYDSIVALQRAVGLVWQRMMPAIKAAETQPATRPSSRPAMD